MGFLDALRRTLSGGESARDKATKERLAKAWGLDELSPPEAPESANPATGSSAYDREIWRRKLTHLLENPPIPETEWKDFLADAYALGFDRDWVEKAQRESFEMLIRKAVSDGVVTLEEHHNIDAARDLIGIPEDEAVALLHQIVAEAEQFFGKTVEGA